MKKYNVIGVMSGTSVDGLDVSFCRFTKNKKWEYEILNLKHTRIVISGKKP